MIDAIRAEISERDGLTPRSVSQRRFARKPWRSRRSAPICWWWSVTPAQTTADGSPRSGETSQGSPVVQVSGVSELPLERLPVDGEVVVVRGEHADRSDTRVTNFLKRYDRSQTAPQTAAVGGKVLPSLRASAKS